MIYDINGVQFVDGAQAYVLGGHKVTVRGIKDGSFLVEVPFKTRKVPASPDELVASKYREYATPLRGNVKDLYERGQVRKSLALHLMTKADALANQKDRVEASIALKLRSLERAIDGAKVNPRGYGSISLSNEAAEISQLRIELVAIEDGIRSFLSLLQDIARNDDNLTPFEEQEFSKYFS